jgi:hypothetical protein
VFIDEISMIGSNTFHSVNTRLQEVTANYTQAFGTLHAILSGDFNQLPPVNASPTSGTAVLFKARAVAVTPLFARSSYESERHFFSTILTKICSGQRRKLKIKS